MSSLPFIPSDDPSLRPVNTRYAQRVQDSFSRQLAMKLIGASLQRVAVGSVDIYLPFKKDLVQQHGYVHGGIVGMIADSACGYAGFSLMAEDTSVLTVEYKINFLAPATGDYLIACGRVQKAGKTLTLARGDVFSIKGEQYKLCAIMMQTLMSMRGMSDDPQAN